MDVDNVVVNVYRGEAIENRHRGHIAVVNAQGKLLYGFGDPHLVTYGRSALKPFQVLPLIESGAAGHFAFDDADIAISCASHSGEQQHRSKVHSILKRIGVDESALQCGVEKPIDKKSYEHMLRAGEDVSAVCNGCSGVHAGMMATAVFLKEDVRSYTSLNHPVQQRVRQAVADMTDEQAEGLTTAVDGCGIPTYLLPLYKIAFAYARIARPDTIVHPHHRAAIQTVAHAMLSRPEMITGSATYTTRLIKLFRGRLLAKEGAQGVYGISDLQTGVGIALKIEDGSPTEIPTVVNHIFRQLGIGIGSDGPLEQLKRDTDPGLKNAPGQVVGRLEASFQLVPTSWPCKKRRMSSSD